MMITLGSFTFAIQPIQSSNGTAAYLGQTSMMIDGRPGTQCPISWPTGAQTTATYITIPFRALASTIDTQSIMLVSCLGIRGIPEGTLVHILRGATANPTTLVRTAVVQKLPNGQLGFWYALTAAQQFSDQYVGFKFFNSVGGVATILAGATVYVGEVYASEVVELPITDLNVVWTDPTKVNRSEGNQPWRVLRRPFRRTDAKIVPKKYADAFNISRSIQNILYRLSIANYFAIVPRPHARAATTPDDTYVNNSAQLVRGVNFGQLGSNASEDAWPVSAAFEELL